LIEKLRQFFLNGFVLKVFFDNFEYMIFKKQVMKKNRYGCKLFKTKSVLFDLALRANIFLVLVGESILFARKEKNSFCLKFT